MNGTNPTNDQRQQQLMAAEQRLTTALCELARLRRMALCGHHDADQFDRAVYAYRAAETDVRAARLALYGEHGEPDPAPVGPPLAITPRLLFARWLVQTGRLTDFPQEQTR